LFLALHFPAFVHHKLLDLRNWG